MKIMQIQVMFISKTSSCSRVMVKKYSCLKFQKFKTNFVEMEGGL